MQLQTFWEGKYLLKLKMQLLILQTWYCGIFCINKNTAMICELTGSHQPII